MCVCVCVQTQVLKRMSVSSAELVMQRAPSWWSPAVEGQMRKRMWEALLIDSPGQLDKAIRVYSYECTHFTGGWEIEDLIIRLRLAMWRHSAGKGPSGKRRGLLHIAAANQAGVPADGAVRCLAHLLKRYPPDVSEYWQLRTALNDCTRLKRETCIGLITPVVRELELRVGGGGGGECTCGHTPVSVEKTKG